MPNLILNSLEDWLKHIESFHSKEIDLGLDRILEVAQRLNCSHFSCPVISVAGTNGKGSTVEMLKQLALVKNLNVGSYTSPHLFKFNERIAINGNPVSDQRLIHAFESIEKARFSIDKNKSPKKIPLSFFEFTSLAAFYLFQESNLDLIILEVGLGGRLDAVNIIDADLAIITNIGIDHTDWLGNSRELIALEKAGIARKGKPCIIGDRDPPATLPKQLRKIGAIPLQVTQDFNYAYHDDHIEFSLKASDSPYSQTLKVPTLSLSLAADNILLAIQAFITLASTLAWTVNEAELKKALSKVQLPGRFQVFNLAEKGLIICDLTHNPAGAKFFNDQLLHYFEAYKPESISALFGVMEDKDIAGIIKAFKSVNHWLLCDLQTKRAATASSLEKIIQQTELYKPEHNINTYSSVDIALEHYLKNAKGGDCLLVFGSFYTVAPAIQYILKLN
jgi:dihydrofolate synthase/folylpolyglutamate synthase